MSLRERLRQAKPPAEVVKLLAAEEEVVSWADTAESVVLVTSRGLWWPSTEPTATHRFIGWHAISKATWAADEGTGVLTVIEADVVDDLLLVDRPPVRVQVTVPRNLPASLRKRVEANVVHTEVVLVGRGSARLVGRRIPGEDGLRWWARLEDGAIDDEPTRLAVAARLARLRDDWHAQRESL